MSGWGLIESHCPFLSSPHPRYRPIAPRAVGARWDVSHLRNWRLLGQDQLEFGCHEGEGCGLWECLAPSFAFPRVWLLTGCVLWKSPAVGERSGTGISV